MPFNSNSPIERCTICGSEANVLRREFGVATVVDCRRCGDYKIVDRVVALDQPLPLAEPERAALASHLIRKIQAGGGRAVVASEFFVEMRRRKLPTPSEASDAMVQWLAERQGERPGQSVTVFAADNELQATIGVVASTDIEWIVGNLTSSNLATTARARNPVTGAFDGVQLTSAGWLRYEDMSKARTSSRFAFFARRFANADLDTVFEKCLFDAVKQTGYELRMVTQKAGLVDAVIEDEIRRCRFLLADLSDDNPGAYWEAGFAEGLGKPVIYVCRATENGVEKKIHFDANHRQTVRWDLASLDQTAIKLKAVIRNTLLGDAKQED